MEFHTFAKTLYIKLMFCGYIDVYKTAGKLI